MFNFFRKLRQSLFSNGSAFKYLSYAIGEIILVVIGIFIAIQANNWNVERNSQKELKQSLEKLLVNLKQDSVTIQLDIATNKEIVNSLDSSLIILKAPDRFTKKEFSSKLFTVNQTTHLEIEKSTFTSLSETGKLASISNGQLLDFIINYYNREYFLSIEDAIINHTREIIRPYLMGFDFILMDAPDLEGIDEVSKFTIPSKSIQDYASDARIVNGIRFKIFLHTRVMNAYRYKLEENNALIQMVKEEIGKE
ncbi:hypothetical protein DFQ04_2968 [Algoriphagus boseongensis]|uniref:Uncharacterized protein n=1 Tax=Algoriphagus boseongensis TaxID=1442587 RepID=A0A4R6T255_9BACT|nr:DUF6090 family protein [Algoriphagus boseongensis]TDQ15082.1 hypothetical protein DFQ04_2968 [Algoriphagus boseongensis]